jgi:hypothetical protein
MRAKTVATWIFGIAVVAGALYVRKQYNDIEAVEKTPPKAAPAPGVAKSQQDKPAASTAAPVVTQASPGATHWFEGLPLGADEAAVLAKFGGQVQKVQRQQFAGAYVDYVIPEYKMAGVPFEVFFQMDNDTKGLLRVLLRKQSENQPRGSYAADFKTVLAALTEKHGKPAGEFRGKRDDTFTDDQTWVGGPVSIELSHSQTVWGSGRVGEMLTVRYFPSDR